MQELSTAGPDELHRREAAQLHHAAEQEPPFVAGVAASVTVRLAATPRIVTAFTPRV